MMAYRSDFDWIFHQNLLLQPMKEVTEKRMREALRPGAGARGGKGGGMAMGLPGGFLPAESTVLSSVPGGIRL